MSKEIEKDVKLEKASKSAKNEKTSEKDAKKKKGGLIKWFKDLRGELNKVVWPSAKTVRNNTSVVLVTVVLTSIFVGALDLGLLRLVNFLYNR